MTHVDEILTVHMHAYAYVTYAVSCTNMDMVCVY